MKLPAAAIFYPSRLRGSLVRLRHVRLFFFCLGEGGGLELGALAWWGPIGDEWELFIRRGKGNGRGMEWK